MRSRTFHIRMGGTTGGPIFPSCHRQIFLEAADPGVIERVGAEKFGSGAFALTLAPVGEAVPELDRLGGIVAGAGHVEHSELVGFASRSVASGAATRRWWRRCRRHRPRRSWWR